MSAGSSHLQVRSSGRFVPADPPLMELQDANEDGTAGHMDLRELIAAMGRVDHQQDLSAAERGLLIAALEQLVRRHEEQARQLREVQVRLRAQQTRDRKLGAAMDHLREKVEALNEVQLRQHRESGGLGCAIQAERQRAGRLANVVIHQNNGSVEVNP